MKNLLLSVILASSAVAFPGSVAPRPVGEPGAGTVVGKIEVRQGRKDENTILYLRGVQGHYEPPPQPAVVDQEGKVFIPHLRALQKGQKVLFKNGDPFTHNVHVFWGNRSMFNRAQPPGSEMDWTPPRTGEYTILCNIHLEMSAFLVVFDHPFFSDTPSSEFKIENIPEGTYTLVAVRDVRGNLKEQESQVTIKSGETTKVNIRF